jgi:hypothetical protein
LNDDYSCANIAFVFKGLKRYNNPKWARDAFAYLPEYTAAARVGSYRTLNIFAHPDLGGNLGFASLPKPIKTQSDITLDSVVVLSTSFPGGSTEGFNLGRTGTHEVGHWFGLAHVFEGLSCTGKGDSVVDTPIQSTPSWGCPIGKDSCPNRLGKDSIRNYMDYSDDAWYVEDIPRLYYPRFGHNAWREVYEFRKNLV